MTEPAPHAFRLGLDGQGGLAPAVDRGIARWTHYRFTSEQAEYLATERRVPLPAAEALLVENARPRASRIENGLLVVLRGVNHDPTSDPEDMVSLRVWLEGDRIVTICPRRVLAIEDVRETLEQGEGPRCAGEILAHLAQRLIERMRPIVDGLEDTTDELHEQLLASGPRSLQRPLAQLRHTIAMLRRHMAPQREVLTRLHKDRLPTLPEPAAALLVHTADLQIRYVEDLDSVRERAGVIQDELDTTVASRLNKNMYLLSIITAIFLPLGLLTGLLGINVGGIPGAASSSGFLVVCGLLVVIAVAEIWVLRRLRLIG